MSKRTSQPPAFTLIELLLVLLILTFIVAIVGPQLRGFTTGRTTSNTATTILAMTHYARTQSVTQGVTYRLNYDDKARSLWISYQSGNGDMKPNNDFATPLNIADSIKIDTDIPSQKDGGQYIEFHPTGRTDPAIITLTDKLGSSIQVGCSSATEQFRIVPPGEVTK
jgi:Tfp pilus assembly protein FimT